MKTEFTGGIVDGREAQNPVMDSVSITFCCCILQFGISG